MMADKHAAIGILIKDRWDFVEAMTKLGLQHTEFKFDTEGVKTILNEENVNG